MIYTIGHSTHSIGDFIQILDAFGVKQLADIRTIPRSRPNPQFNEQELGETLKMVIPYGFDALQFARIEASPIPQNMSSCRLLEKNGFTPTRDYMSSDQGIVHQYVRFEFIPHPD